MPLTQSSLPPRPPALTLENRDHYLTLNSAEQANILIQKLIALHSGLTIIATSGLPGGGKSTTTNAICGALGADISLIGFRHNQEPMRLLEMDHIMSVSRGQEKMSLLTTASTESIRSDFFRTAALAEIIKSAVSKKPVRITEAYNPGDNGQRNAVLEMNQPDSASVMITEGVVASAAINIALDTLSDAISKQVLLVNMIVYTDPAVALLNTVKRGTERADRKKDPVYAFKEFLIFSELLLPGYIKYDLQSLDILIVSENLDQMLFGTLIDFFKQDQFKHLPKEFMSIIESKPSCDCPIIDAYRSHLINALQKIQQLITAVDMG